MKDDGTTESVADSVIVYNSSLEFFAGDELAASTVVDKYLLKRPNGNSFVYDELNPSDMHRRHAKAIAAKESQYSNSLSEDDIYEYLWHFRKIVLGGSPMYGMGNPYVNVSLSNCIVIASPEDSISGIIESGKEMANLFKARCGVGLDISSLRPDGARVNNSAGTSTGAWSFADFFSNVCRMIGQNGRRGALMITMDVRHPDIEQFVVMKRDLGKVTGANISVLISDEFMQAVENDSDWELCWPVNVSAANEKIFKRTIRARDLWNSINESATICAEPGIIFWDTYKNNLPANEYDEFKSVSTNPCSEISLSPYDSCRLTSINLKHFVRDAFTEIAQFDFEDFEKTVRTGMRVMDDVVDLEIDCLRGIISTLDRPEEIEIWKKLETAAANGRRTGLGTHGLADCLARLCIKYDSDEAVAMVEKIYECFRNSAYDESVILAQERGAFPAFDWDTEKDNIFIKRLPQNLQERIEKYGRRNISLLTMAPTGSVSIVSQTSSGIEPVFMNAYIRRKKINPTDPNPKVDMVDDKGDKWTEYFVFHHNVMEYLETHPSVKQQWEEIQEENSSSEWSRRLTKILPDYFVTAHDIDPMKRVQVQGAIQQFVDHGISSTINCPTGTPVDVVQKIYEYAWKCMLKGVTVYVDGSRSGVLVSKKDDNPIEIVEASAPKRPKEMLCDIHHSQIDGKKWVILVGTLNGIPYEIFGGSSEHVVIPRRYTRGKVLKRKCDQQNAKGRYNCYDLYVGDEDDPLIVQDIVSTFDDGDYAAATRLISLSLRHGVPIQFIAEQLGRDKESSFMSFSRVMARVLKKYVEDGLSAEDTCEECGAKLVFESGCIICRNCGASPKCS
jgi:ribonucleoside-diphosphate reductase alpha chain